MQLVTIEDVSARTSGKCPCKLVACLAVHDEGACGNAVEVRAFVAPTAHTAFCCLDCAAALEARTLDLARSGWWG